MGKFLNSILAAALICAAAPSSAEVSYDLTITPDVVSGSRTIDGKVEKFSFKAEEEAGLILVSRRTIAKQLGDTKRADVHPFSFADPEPTRVVVKVPSGYFTFTSFLSDKAQYLPRTTSQFVVGVAKDDLWVKSQFKYLGTNFELINPRKSPHIEPKHWEASVKKIWKVFTEKLGNPTDHLVFVDLDGPISGGPLGENVLGMFATEKMNPEFQEDMKANLGWDPKPTSKAYVEANYPKSPNQWDEYLFGTFAHEIGHLFFGFGLTRQKVSNADDLWFSLGLGMLYDMDVTKQLIGRKPQLELDIIKSWLTKYSSLADIDQRLVNPDKSADKKYPFDRKKVFAHGKAVFYLEKVREKIGAEPFDAAVIEYVKNCGACDRGYEDFKKFLGKYSKDLAELEKQHKVL